MRLKEWEEGMREKGESHPALSSSRYRGREEGTVAIVGAGCVQ